MVGTGILGLGRVPSHFLKIWVYVPTSIHYFDSQCPKIWKLYHIRFHGFQPPCFCPNRNKMTGLCPNLNYMFMKRCSRILSIKCSFSMYVFSTSFTCLHSGTSSSVVINENLSSDSCFHVPPAQKSQLL
jgi:hypothetical protein